MGTSRWVRSTTFVIVVTGVAVALACGGLGGGGDIDPADLQAPSAEGLGRKLLVRFERTIDLDSLSVQVEEGGSEPRALRFDYYTPLGDKHFTIAIRREGDTWRADSGDVIAVEKKFSR